MNNVADNGFSEVHTAPGLEPASGKLRLVALRTTPCATGTKVCHLVIQIDPDGATSQKNEPLLVRDSFNRLGDGPDHRYYRNFVMPPYAMKGYDGRPILGWLTRGMFGGESHEDTAYLRRAGVKPSGRKSKSAGVVKLMEFAESAEPVVIVRRNSAQPRLVSISFDEFRGKVSIKQWRLPEAMTEVRREALNKEQKYKVCWGFHPTNVPPDKCVEKSRPLSDEETGCNPNDLDESWLIRAPVVVAGADDSDRIIFSRFVVATPEVRGPSSSIEREIVLQVRQVMLGHDATCKFSRAKSHRLGWRTAESFPSSEQRDKEINVANAYAALRGAPVLVTDLDGDRNLDIVIPSIARISRSPTRIMNATGD